MSTTLLRPALLHCSTRTLGQVIDWLDRPWALRNNDSLRATWHEAHRSEGARRALAYALEDEIRGLATERDIAHVSQRLGVHVPGTDALIAEIVRRIGGPSAEALPVSPETVAAALQATADIARLVLGNSYRGRGHSRRRHGR